MNKNANIIRPEGDDKLVMSVTLYQDEDTLFYDSALTKSVTQEEAIDLFNKGLMLVAVDDGFKRPTGITIGEEGAYTIAFGEGGSDNGSILCYGSEFDGSYYLFEDEEHTIPITSDKDPLWYFRLILNTGCSTFQSVVDVAYGSGHESKYITFSDSIYYFDYNGPIDFPIPA